MGKPDREQAVALIESLKSDPYRFSLFWAINVIENYYADYPAVGKSFRLDDEPFRFDLMATLSFQPSAITSVNHQVNKNIFRLEQRVFGLLGTDGPLPRPYTEYVMERIRHKRDRTLWAFLNLFHHRLLSLFYRAWAVNQVWVDIGKVKDSRFKRQVSSLVGLATPGMQQRDSLPDDAKNYYAGVLGGISANPSNLQKILSDYFQIKVRVLSFISSWISLPEEDYTLLGRPGLAGRLGKTAFIGRRLRDCQIKFRIVIDHLSIADFERFFPSGSALHAMVDWVRLYVGLNLVWDLQLGLRADERPPLHLGYTPEHKRLKGSCGKNHLGWNCWLGKPRETQIRRGVELLDDFKIDPSLYNRKLWCQSSAL